MSDSSIKRMQEIVLTGLSQSRRPQTLEVKHEYVDTTFRTQVKLTLPFPNLFGGGGSLLMDVTLPTGEKESLDFLHLVNLTLVSLMDSLSSSLNTALSHLKAGTSCTTDSLVKSSDPVPTSAYKDLNN